MTLAHLEILVEELSMERALRHLIPKIAPSVGFGIRKLNGKADLLKKLPDRLAGYRTWLPSTHAVVVIVDRDNDDCRALRDRLDRAAISAGFTPISVTSDSEGNIANRLAIEELEAWFFGDVDALRLAYPHLPDSIERSVHVTDPDAIIGGTWEALERVLQRAGYHPGGLRKPRAAHEIARHMNVEANRSVSFGKFRDGVRLLVNGAA